MIGPTRTCIGCRERTAKSELLRLVWQGTRVQVDPRQTAPGRGAYLHHRVACLDIAERKRAVSRALRVPGGRLGLDDVRVTLNESAPRA